MPLTAAATRAPAKCAGRIKLLIAPDQVEEPCRHFWSWSLCKAPGIMDLTWNDWGGWLVWASNRLWIYFGYHAKWRQRQRLSHNLQPETVHAAGNEGGCRNMTWIWHSLVSKSQRQRQRDESACRGVIVLLSIQTLRWFGNPFTRLQWRLRKLNKYLQTAASFWIKVMCLNVPLTVYSREQWCLYPNH